MNKISHLTIIILFSFFNAFSTEVNNSEIYLISNKSETKSIANSKLKNKRTKVIHILSGIKLENIKIIDSKGNNITKSQYKWEQIVGSGWWYGSPCKIVYKLVYKVKKGVEWVKFQNEKFELEVTDIIDNERKQVFSYFEDSILEGVFKEDYSEISKKKCVPKSSYSNKITRAPADRNTKSNDFNPGRVFLTNGKVTELSNMKLVFLVGLDSKRRILQKLKISGSNGIYEVEIKNIKSIDKIITEKNFNYDVKSARVNLNNGQSFYGSFYLSLVEGGDINKGIKVSIPINRIRAINLR